MNNKRRLLIPDLSLPKMEEITERLEQREELDTLPHREMELYELARMLPGQETTIESAMLLQTFRVCVEDHIPRLCREAVGIMGELREEAFEALFRMEGGYGKIITGTMMRKHCPDGMQSAWEVHSEIAGEWAVFPGDMPEDDQFSPKHYAALESEFREGRYKGNAHLTREELLMITAERVLCADRASEETYLRLWKKMILLARRQVLEQSIIAENAIEPLQERGDAYGCADNKKLPQISLTGTLR